MKNVLQKHSDVEFDLLADVGYTKGVFYLLQNKIMLEDLLMTCGSFSLQSHCKWLQQLPYLNDLSWT